MNKSTKIVLIFGFLIFIGFFVASVIPGLSDKIERESTYHFFLTQLQIDGLIEEESEGGWVVKYDSGTGEEEKEMCIDACSKRCVDFGYKYYDSLPIFDESSEEKCSCFCE